MWLVILIIVVYLFAAGFTHRTMLTYKGYETYNQIPHNNEDAPLIVFGSMFWPITVLLYLGMIMSRKLTGN